MPELIRYIPAALLACVCLWATYMRLYGDIDDSERRWADVLVVLTAIMAVGTLP